MYSVCSLEAPKSTIQSLLRTHEQNINTSKEELVELPFKDEPLK